MLAQHSVVVVQRLAREVLLREQLLSCLAKIFFITTLVLSTALLRM